MSSSCPVFYFASLTAYPIYETNHPFSQTYTGLESVDQWIRVPTDAAVEQTAFTAVAIGVRSFYGTTQALFYTFDQLSQTRRMPLESSTSCAHKM